MRKGQSILEYSILLIVIVAAFISMQMYMKRGFQGRWKQAAEDLGDQYDVNAFNSNVRYTLDSTTMSNTSVIHDVSYNGVNGMITYRQDTATTIETKNGASHVDK